MRFLLFIILFLFSLSSCVVENKYTTNPPPKRKFLHVEWRMENGHYWHHHQFPKRPRPKNGNYNNHQSNHNGPRK